MPSHLSPEQVQAIAELARLRLEPAEIDVFTRQLEAILAYADEVQQVDTTHVLPTASVLSRHATDRADHVEPCLDRADALANAPDAAVEAGLFKVPRVIG